MTNALRAIAGGKHIGRDPALDVSPKPLKTSFQPRIVPTTADSYNSHPAVGLTVEMLISIFRQAERGYPVKQFDMFDDMIEIDGHLRGLIIADVDAVAGCEWVIAPGRDDKPSRIASEALDDSLRNQTPFRDFIEHHLMSPHYGFSATNTIWGIVDRLVTPVEFRHGPHRRFASPTDLRANEIWLVGGDTSSELIRLEPGEWAVSRYRNARNPWAAGKMRTASWWAMFKRWSIRDWQVFANMFGLPLVLGFYNELAGEQSRLKLEDAVKQIGEDGYAVLSDLVEIVIKDTARSGDSSTVYPKIAKLAEEQMSKLIAGATTASDTGGDVGSYALGTVHESRAYKISLSNAAGVQNTVREDIGRPFVIWNGFDRAAPPRMKIKINRDSLEHAKRLQIIGQVVELDAQQIYEDFGLRVPAPGTGVKFPVKAPAGGDQ